MEHRHLTLAQRTLAVLGLVLLIGAAPAAAAATGGGYPSVGGSAGHAGPRIVPSAPHSAPVAVHYGKKKAPRRVWVAGAWIEQEHRVWVRGHTERVWQEPAFEWRYDSCGRRLRVQLGIGCWRTIEHPGHWRVEHTRVWRPGHWSTANC